MVNLENKQYFYVYLITNIITNIKYIGSRGCKCLPEDDIGKRYFSSSSDIEFINHQKNYPEQYKYDILSIHDTRKDAFIEEERLHTLYNVAFNTEYKNKCKCQVGENMRFNMTTVYDENKNTVFISLDDENYTSGKYKHVNHGLLMCMNSHGEFKRMSINDERYISGEFKSQNYGARIPVFINGVCKFINKEDYYNEDNEYKHVNYGKTRVYDNNGNCIVVNKDDDKIGVDYKHINYNKTVIINDKGETIQIDKNDENFLNGTFKHPNRCMSNVYDNNGNHYYIKSDDPRILSGELVTLKTRRVTIIDKDGNTKSVFNDDPKFLSGEYKAITTGKMNAIDKDGKTYYVDCDDHRILSGELVSVGKNKKYVKDKNGNTLRIDKGTNIDGFYSCSKGRISMYDKYGNKFTGDVTDEKYINGEYISAYKIKCLDADGNKIKVDKTDPRIKDGTITIINEKLLFIKSFFYITGEICV